MKVGNPDELENGFTHSNVSVQQEGELALGGWHVDRTIVADVDHSFRCSAGRPTSHRAGRNCGTDTRGYDMTYRTRQSRYLLHSNAAGPLFN